jgi:hypothetical protein
VLIDLQVVGQLPHGGQGGARRKEARGNTGVDLPDDLLVDRLGRTDEYGDFHLS